MAHGASSPSSPGSPCAGYSSLRGGPASANEESTAAAPRASVCDDEGAAALLHGVADAPCWHGRRAALRLFSLVAMVVVATAASVAHLGRCFRPQQQHHQKNEAVVLEQDRFACSAEADVGYWTNHSISERRHVKTAKECRVLCDQRPQCGAWTWGKVSPEVCSLMRLEDGQLPDKSHAAGAVSGFACGSDAANVRRAATSSALRAAEANSSSSAGAESAVPREMHPPLVPPAPSASPGVVLDMCGPVEADVDYWTWSPLGQQQVKSARECLEQCAMLPTCGSWTWIKAHGMQEMSGVCFLKGMSDDIVGTRHHTRGVISGLCRSRSGAGRGEEVAISSSSDSVAQEREDAQGAGIAAESAGSSPAGSRRSTAKSAGRAAGNHHLDPAAGRKATTTAEAGLVNSSTTAASRSRQSGASNDTSATSRALNPISPGASSTRRAIVTDTTTTSFTVTVLSLTGTSTTTLSSTTVLSLTGTSTTAAPVRISLPHETDAELFCFSVMVPNSEEQSLLVIAWQNKAGVFECDNQTIYSSVEIEIAPAVVTHRVDSDLHCESGGEFQTALNLPIFLAVWQKVIEEGDFGRFEWTVKVDPDSVFFPSRLRAALLRHPVEGADAGIYLNNCQFGLHGPIEVFSRAAVKTWYEGTQRCIDHFWEACSGDCQWGEDIFIDQCLWKVLGAKREDEDALLVEEHCDPWPESWRDCEDNFHVALHPFKTGMEWVACWTRARNWQ